ncbi:phosphonoacetaldehyde hydrolase [Roseateles albus]|uniref:Phosphonoacetaldehyde hydrolase n=1 Tax=Roseateles albus TaxID=2987525 RepID=A0ABT5KB19_9BURK|nr:phosphonoacetaldehyde hydrolase [Roseateles albus]MDC8771123.1 phosphonoacetaldehyde hydrolase [Roseateles albus]
MSNNKNMQHLQAVVFDWAGTIIDFGSLAPMGAFVQLFARYDVSISIAEARVPMGLAKWDHIHALGNQPDIAQRWRQAHGRDFSDADCDELYEVFTPMNQASVTQHASLIPGALETVVALRARGLKIGSTTGYNRPIMDVVAPLAEAQGYKPDNLVCAGDMASARPGPLMMVRTLSDLGVWPPAAVVKVDDTVPGLQEGRAVGAWVVGLAVTGNCLGLSEAEWLATPPERQALLRAQAHQLLLDGGAHFVIDGVADLLPLIAEIERRMAAGELPA